MSLSPYSTAVKQISLHAPLFDLTLTAVKDQLVSVDFGWSFSQEETDFLRKAKDEFHCYFDGDKTSPFNLDYILEGFSVFQPIYQEISKIKYGKTLYYSDLAKKLSLTEKDILRAIMENPLPILIPCHRLIFEDTVGPYCGEGGPETKKTLLALEGAIPPL